MSAPFPWHPSGTLRGPAGVQRLLGMAACLPDQAYVLSNDGTQVWVLGRLNQLARERRTPAANLVAQAWVSPLEAVSKWGVVPFPYRPALAPGGQEWLIRHEPFCTTLPGRYPTGEAAAGDLARLMSGHCLPGDGQFTYRGQAMTLEAPLAPDMLPKRPLVTLASAVARRCRKHLARLDYVRGFPPLTESVFVRVRHLESSWLDHCAAVSQEVRSPLRLDDLHRVLERHNTEPDLPELDSDTAARLAKLSRRYPDPAHGLELLTLGLHALAAEQPTADLENILGAGEVAALALMNGAQVSDAMHMAWRWYRYDCRLRALAQRIEIATFFLMDDLPAVRWPAASTAERPGAAGLDAGPRDGANSR